MSPGVRRRQETEGGRQEEQEGFAICLFSLDLSEPKACSR